MDGTGGYAGWRWIFIIEGVVTVGIAIISKFLIADWPEQAKFLSESEKALLALRLERDGAGGSCRMDHLDMAAVKRILSDWKIWCG
jgi:sugar phosphate permease